jgi:hypothetical protein
MSDDNGAAASDPLASAAADLRAFLAETDREDRRLRHELVVLQAKTRRAKRALDALTADESKASAKPKAQRSNPASKERQEEVIAAMRAGARTVAEIAEHMGTSKATARTTVYYLRDIERVRMTGKVRTSPSAPTPAATYALMPGGDDGS